MLYIPFQMFWDTFEIQVAMPSLIYFKHRRSKVINTSVDILLDSLDRNFILKKIYRASWVKFINGNHSTRSSFYGFILSEFRVIVEYFWRSIVILIQLVESDDSDETQIVYK